MLRDIRLVSFNVLLCSLKMAKLNSNVYILYLLGC